MAVVGLRGTGSFSADERPKNYRGVLLLLNPNTEAPLTAMLGQLKDAPTDDAEYKCFIKGLPTQRQVVSAAVNTTVTTITMQGAGSQTVFKPGHAVMIETTGEVVWVTNASTAKTIVVKRGKGSTAAAIATGAGLFILGSHHQEGAAVPSAITYDPTVVTNYTQIFRTVGDLTGTALATRLRYADNPKIEMKREMLEIHAIEMEKQFLFGSGVEDTSGSQPERTTKGAFFFITTNVHNHADAVTITGWELAQEADFADGMNEKLLLCGNRVLTIANQLGRSHGTLNIAPKSETFGLQVVTWITPFGTLQLKQHPLLSKNATFKDWAFQFDTARLMYRYLRGRDTKYLRDRQSPGDDATKDEFLSECGLEIDFESYHAVHKNMSAMAP